MGETDHDIVNTEYDIPTLRPHESIKSRERFFSTKRYKKAKIRKRRNQKQDSHSKNRGGKKLNKQSDTYTMKTYRKPNEQLFSQ